MQTTFFATDADIAQLWRWFFEMPDMRVCETHSRPDQDNRWFDSWDDLQTHYEDFPNNLGAWSPIWSGSPLVDKITFAENYQKVVKAKGRTILRSPAFISILRNNDQKGCLASSAISGWSEKGARQQSMFPKAFLDQVDWKAFKATFSNISRRIEKNSPARVGAYPIMSDAFEKWQAGNLALWLWGESCACPSDKISIR